MRERLRGRGIERRLLKRLCGWAMRHSGGRTRWRCCSLLRGVGPRVVGGSAFRGSAEQIVGGMDLDGLRHRLDLHFAIFKPLRLPHRQALLVRGIQSLPVEGHIEIEKV
jgi:hypothetical protein